MFYITIYLACHIGVKLGVKLMLGREGYFGWGRVSLKMVGLDIFCIYVHDIIHYVLSIYNINSTCPYKVASLQNYQN